MVLPSLDPSFYLFALSCWLLWERRISLSQKRVVSEPIRSNCRGCCCANPERVDPQYTCVLLRRLLCCWVKACILYETQCRFVGCSCIFVVVIPPSSSQVFSVSGLLQRVCVSVCVFCHWQPRFPCRHREHRQTESAIGSRSSSVTLAFSLSFSDSLPCYLQVWVSSSTSPTFNSSSVA